MDAKTTMTEPTLDQMRREIQERLRSLRIAANGLTERSLPFKEELVGLSEYVWEDMKTFPVDTPKLKNQHMIRALHAALCGRRS